MLQPYFSSTSALVAGAKMPARVRTMRPYVLTRAPFRARGQARAEVGSQPRHTSVGNVSASTGVGNHDAAERSQSQILQSEPTEAKPHEQMTATEPAATGRSTARPTN